MTKAVRQLGLAAQLLWRRNAPATSCHRTTWYGTVRWVSSSTAISSSNNHSQVAASPGGGDSAHAPHAGGKPKVLVVSGPTGVGKTELAVHLAKQIDGEIVVADSVQIFAGTEIGGNHPTTLQQEGIPHHLLGSLSMKKYKNCSAAMYHDMAYEAIHSILQRNKVPIVVGGATMYLKWLLYGIPNDDLQSDSKLQHEIRDTVERIGWSASVQLLRQYDRDYAEKIPPNDYYRLIRGLEKCIRLEGPLTTHRLPRHSSYPHDMDAFPYDFRCFFLLPDSRVKLSRWLDQRFELMIQQGFLREVATLLHTGTLTDSHMVAKAVGYRQAIRFLTQLQSTEFGKELFDQFLLDAQTASRGYARQQIKWFRADPMFRFLSYPIASTSVTTTDRLSSQAGSSAPVNVQVADEVLRHFASYEGAGWRQYHSNLVSSDEQKHLKQVLDKAETKEMRRYQPHVTVLKQNTPQQLYSRYVAPALTILRQQQQQQQQSVRSLHCT